VTPRPLRLPISAWDALPPERRREEAGVRYVALWDGHGPGAAIHWARVELVADERPHERAELP
jgi:hypothetical protein